MKISEVSFDRIDLASVSCDRILRLVTSLSEAMFLYKNYLFSDKMLILILLMQYIIFGAFYGEYKLKNEPILIFFREFP